MINNLLKPQHIPSHELRKRIFKFQIYNEIIHLHCLNAAQFNTLNNQVLYMEALTLSLNVFP
jgi:hypothetical protein